MYSRQENWNVIHNHVLHLFKLCRGTLLLCLTVFLSNWVSQISSAGCNKHKQALYSFSWRFLLFTPLHSLITLKTEKCRFPSGGMRGHWDWVFSMQPLLFHDSLNPFSLVCNWTPLIYMHEGCIILREVLWSKKKRETALGPGCRRHGKTWWEQPA